MSTPAACGNTAACMRAVRALPACNLYIVAKAFGPQSRCPQRCGALQHGSGGRVSTLSTFTIINTLSTLNSMPRATSNAEADEADTSVAKQPPPTYNGAPRHLPLFLAKMEDWLPYQDANFGTLLSTRTVTYRTRTYCTHVLECTRSRASS